MAKAQAAFGAIDILVNNAGIQFVAPIDEFPVAKWNEIIALNLTASFHTIRLVLPAMKARKWGRIVNIASAHALVASPYKSAYVAAKHGVAGLTKTVALEVATQGITMNAICPGYVWTPLVERQIPDTAKARGHHRGAGDQRRTAARAADEEVRAGRRGRCADAVPRERRGGFDYGSRDPDRRWLDGAVTARPTARSGRSPAGLGVSPWPGARPKGLPDARTAPAGLRRGLDPQLPGRNPADLARAGRPAAVAPPAAAARASLLVRPVPPLPATGRSAARRHAALSKLTVGNTREHGDRVLS